MSDDMSCWRELIAAEAEKHGDDISGLVIYPEKVLWPRDKWSDKQVEGSMQQPTLDVRFDSGYGTSQGPAFTAWSAQRVYFPVVYDGAEWAGSAPRNPCDDDTEHVGGQ